MGDICLRVKSVECKKELAMNMGEFFSLIHSSKKPNVKKGFKKIVVIIGTI